MAGRRASDRDPERRTDESERLRCVGHVNRLLDTSGLEEAVIARRIETRSAKFRGDELRRDIESRRRRRAPLEQIGREKRN